MEKTVTPYDPNAIAADRKTPQARVPRPPEMMRGFAQDADSYLKAIHKGFHDIEYSLTLAAKALNTPPQSYSYARIAYMPDVSNSGLLQWPGINPDSLRKIARDNLLPMLITNARVSDLARYSQPSTVPWRPGWQISIMESGRAPSTQERKDILEAQRFIYNCNVETKYDQARDRDKSMVAPFEQFLRAAARDLYTFDSLAIWTDMDNSDRVKAFSLLPAGNIRMANPRQGYKGNIDQFAALLDEAGNPITAFTRDELVWRVMNPRTEPEAYGYGLSPLEQGVRAIQGFQSAVDLNCDTFTKSGIPEAIIALMGDYWNDDQMDLLLREWQNMKNGVSKSWGLPFLSIPEEGDIKIIPLNDIKGNDVRYRDHMNMMCGIFCMVSQFPVRRLGLFASGHNHDNMPLPDESVEEQGVDDAGLPPLLFFVAETVNQYLLWSRWPHLKFSFTNTDPKTDAREYEAKKNARCWRESRAEVDLPPLAKLFPADMKEIAEIMELCPEDPNKASVFQTVAVTLLKAKLGLDKGGDDTANGELGNESAPGQRMTSKKDPAQSQAHGHRAGVRRNSPSERREKQVSFNVNDIVSEAVDNAVE
jgi:hypothetical protein